MTQDTYELAGVPLDDPQRRWALASGTQLPQWGAPNIASVEVPTIDGVLPTAPSSMGPMTVKIQVLIFAAHRQEGLDQFRALTSARTLLGIIWRTPTRAVESQCRVSSSVDIEQRGYAGDLLLTFTVELPTGEWYSQRRNNWTVGTGTKLITVDTARPAIVDYVGAKTPVQGGHVMVRDRVSGTWLGVYNMDAGITYRVDTRNWTAHRSPAGTPLGAIDQLRVDQMDPAPVVRTTLSMPPSGLRLGVDPATRQAEVSASGGEAVVFWRGCF